MGGWGGGGVFRNQITLTIFNVSIGIQSRFLNVLFIRYFPALGSNGFLYTTQFLVSRENFVDWTIEEHEENDEQIGDANHSCDHDGHGIHAKRRTARVADFCEDR